MLHVARLAGARTYEIQLAQGDPSLEANWKSATASHMLVEDLTPAHT